MKNNAKHCAGLLAGVLMGSALCAMNQVNWIQNVPGRWLDEANWDAGYAPGGENDTAPEETYAYMSGSHVDVTLDGAISPINVLGMYDEVKLLAKDTKIEISGTDAIFNLWHGSVLTLDNSTLTHLSKNMDFQNSSSIIAKNGSKLQLHLVGGNSININSTSSDIFDSSQTIHLQSGSTIDAQGSGDIFFNNQNEWTGVVNLIFEGEGSGVSNFSDAANANRAIWLSGMGDTNLTFKNTEFDGLIAINGDIGNRAVVFDGANIDTKTANANFIYQHVGMLEKTAEMTFKNNTIAKFNGKAVTVGVAAGSDSIWSFNVDSGSKLEGLGGINIGSAEVLGAEYTTMSLNVRGGGSIEGKSMVLGQNISGEGSSVELNIEGAGSKVNFIDALIGSSNKEALNTVINIKDADNGALYTRSALYLNAGTLINIELANRNANVAEGMIFGFHIGAETDPTFMVDFSELTLGEGIYRFALISYEGDYHPQISLQDFDVSYYFGKRSGFVDAWLVEEGKTLFVEAYTEGCVIPEPGAFAAVLGLAALLCAAARRRGK